MRTVVLFFSCIAFSGICVGQDVPTAPTSSSEKIGEPVVISKTFQQITETKEDYPGFQLGENDNGRSMRDMFSRKRTVTIERSGNLRRCLLLRFLRNRDSGRTINRTRTVTRWQ
jgi:hypothetical protein